MKPNWSITAAIVLSIILIASFILPAHVEAVSVDAGRRVCYTYTVRLPQPSCNAIDWCVAMVRVNVNGTSSVTVKVTGWHLREGQTKTVKVCR